MVTLRRTRPRKEAVKRHDHAGDELMNELELYCKRATLVVKAVGTALAISPPVQERMNRAPRPRTQEEAKARRKHLWGFAEGTWRCEICATWVATHRLQGRKRREECPGPCLESRIEEFDGKGHRLCRTEGPVPIVFCSRCGAWSSRRPRKLKQQCAQATAPGRQALQRLASGQRPWIARSRNGDGGRGRVGRIAAFSSLEGAWKTSTGRGTKRKIVAAANVEAQDPATGPGAKSGGADSGGASQPPQLEEPQAEDEFAADEEAPRGAS